MSDDRGVSGLRSISLDGSSRAMFVVSIALLSIAALAVGFAGVGLAADNPGLLDFNPAETAADPGETVTADVTLAAMGGYDDDGVQSFAYTVAYDTQILTVIDVEIGPWMYQENETEVVTETTIDEDDPDGVGRLTVRQSREPPAGGVSDIGDTPTATITFAIAEDAPSADAVVQFEDAEAELLEFPLPVLTTRELVVSVDGGGERYAPLDTADEDDDSEEPGVTLADDSDTDSPDSETDQTGILNTADGIDAVVVGLVGLVALGAAVTVAYRRRR